MLSGKIERFIPRNEMGVLYLFARNHEKMGFEKIIALNQSSTPDIVALQGGRKVGIELEYNSSKVFEHYRVLYASEQQETERKNLGKWVADGAKWNYVDRSGRILLSKEDTDKCMWVDEQREVLLFRTLKSVGIDLVIYWEETPDFKFWPFDSDVSRIDLSKVEFLE